ncbi:hypothetical protein CVT25_001426 [Psilocybe cyanescens]|uniref:UDP-glycosyltransferases domain-containing protein n=1 Tax=Psilocybe cyanescens TaxID=93625 RepID=A0A409WNP4_PSICY|nr:hypothetical protein CVT25_001426 [Psilocybe cyanescens]
MSSMSQKIPHFLFSAFPSWGHVRSFCNLAARIVKDNDSSFVTLLLTPNLLNRAKDELEVEFKGKASESVVRRSSCTRILALFHSESQHPLELFEPHAKAYAAAYSDLLQSKAVTCGMTKSVFDAAPPPNVVVLDTVAYPLFQITRAVTGKSVPIISWITGHVSSVIRFNGLERLGGLGDIGAKIDAEAAHLGVTAKDIGDSLWDTSNGTVIKVPGLTEMYDWEYFPQKLPFDIILSDFLRLSYAGLRESDAGFVTSAYVFEAESMEAIKSWFSEWNQDIYIIGPLLPTGYGIDEESDRGSKETSDFLQKSLVEYGENSVMLISFGTVYWPAVQDYIEEVIEALIEKKFPFILCYASPFATLSDELIERIRSSGIGLVSKWSPQQYILNHPATGWFVSHCGHNSTMESLGSGTPVICWPFHADQPMGAAHISEDLKVGLELVEVRTGDRGIKPLKRDRRQAKGTREAVGVEIRQVIDDCRGEKGKILQKNAAEMKAKLAGVWLDGGDSKKDFEAFLAKYGF